MNIAKVHTPPMFIAWGLHPFDRGTGAREEFRQAAHPWKIHHEGYRALNKGYGSTR